MKRIFVLCTAAAALLSGLTSCGGGGDTNKGFVSAKAFRAGAGFKLLGNPSFIIVANAVSDEPGYIPSTPDGSISKPEFVVPGTGSPAVEDDPETPDVDESRPEVEPDYYEPVGDVEIVQRRVGPDGRGSYNAVITYTMTAEDVGIAKISFSGSALDDEDLIKSLGIGANENNNNNWGNNNDNEQTLDRITLNDLGATNVTIYFNFRTGTAQVLITASGVNAGGDNDDDDNGGGYTATESVLTASSIPFIVIR
ncbi:MAG: hypothetical protein IKJ58_05800 [Akkermansia sp.]|nr:hypothetical protein [Akkermansia sp.]